MAGEAAGATLAGSISVNRDLTEAALLRLITAAGVFWLALQLCRDAGNARALVAAVALIGAVYAAYGLIAAKTGWLRMPDMPQGGVVSATFINPNAYAAFAGIGLVATVGIFLRLCRRHGIGGSGLTRHQAAALIDLIGRAGAPVLIGGFMLLAALFLTGSRGGIAATGLAVVPVALLVRCRGTEGGVPGWSLPVLGLALAGGTGLVFGAALHDKLAGAGLSDANRFAVYRLVSESILDRPWLGWGYGTFIDVFPMYRDGSVAGSGTWSQAHNTGLEVVQGLGIVFGAVLIALFVLLALRCFGGAVSRRENATVPLVACGAAILAGAHALIDFSLQMQAVALTVTALLGAGVAQAKSSQLSLGDGAAAPLRDNDAPPLPVRAAWRPRLTALLVVALCGYAGLRGYDLSLAATQGAAGRHAAPFSETGSETGGGTARRWHGLPGLGRAAFDLPLAQIAAADPDTGRRRTEELAALVAARPLSSQAWLSLAIFRLVAREEPASVLAALRLSWIAGPNEGGVHWQRGVFGLALWDFLPEDGREWTVRDMARAMLAQLVAGHQAAAIKPVMEARSVEARAQIRALLEKHGLQPADLARLGLHPPGM
jgi:O-antigen ligase